MLKKTLNPSLMETLQELGMYGELLMTAHALISARFYVVPKVEKTVDGLPIGVLCRLSGDKFVLYQVSSVRESATKRKGRRHSLNIDKRTYASKDEG